MCIFNTLLEVLSFWFLIFRFGKFRAFSSWSTFSYSLTYRFLLLCFGSFPIMPLSGLLELLHS